MKIDVTDYFSSNRDNIHTFTRTRQKCNYCSKYLWNRIHYNNSLICLTFTCRGKHATQGWVPEYRTYIIKKYNERLAILNEIKTL